MNGAANARIGAAAADVAGHGFVDVFVAGFGDFLEQDGGAHDLPRLAVAALRNIDLDPGALEGMAEIVRQTFDGLDVLARDTRQRRNARADGFAIEVDS